MSINAEKTTVLKGTVAGSQNIHHRIKNYLQIALRSKFEHLQRKEKAM
jgi:two-component sensor histidine kinase